MNKTGDVIFFSADGVSQELRLLTWEKKDYRREGRGHKDSLDLIMVKCNVLIRVLALY